LFRFAKRVSSFPSRFVIARGAMPHAVRVFDCPCLHTCGPPLRWIARHGVRFEFLALKQKESGFRDPAIPQCSRHLSLSFAFLIDASLPLCCCSFRRRGGCGQFLSCTAAAIQFCRWRLAPIASVLAVTFSAEQVQSCFRIDQTKRHLLRR